MIDGSIDLTGQRILVVEGDVAAGSELCRDLKRYGATVLGPAPTSHYAYLLLMGRRGIDGAVLHVPSMHRELYELAESLRRRGVPMIFATDGEGDPISSAFDDAPRFPQPLQARELALVINRLIQSGTGPSQPVIQPQVHSMMPQIAASERMSHAISQAMRCSIRA